MQTALTVEKQADSGTLTASPQPVERSSVEQILAMPTIGEQEAETLRRWLSRPVERPAPIEQAELVRMLRYLRTCLPSKNVDDDGGRAMLNAYCGVLGIYTHEQIQYACRRAMNELQWFPAAAKLAELARDQRTLATVDAMAEQRLRAFTDSQFEAFCDGLRAGCDQEWIDSHPLQWRRIAVERGLLRMADGAMVLRSAA